MSDVRLVGGATPEGSKRGSESFGAGTRALGRTGLTVSPVGFGGYRVQFESPLHRRALADALRGGVNLIDTSTNYTDGRSERLVGTVLADLVQRGEIRREHVVVVSKIGYLQGSNLARTRDRQPPYGDIVQYADDCWHCIDPEFIADQLEESLSRLGLEKLDVLLLHNPEYALSDAANRGIAPDAAAAVYDDRLRRAFVALEEAVAASKIGWYGISSNGFVEGPDAPTSNSLFRALELAREAGGDAHHFGVAQLPMNLFELGAVSQTFETPAGPRTPLQIAIDADVGVLVNRPLNAFVRPASGAPGAGRLLRLADAVSEAGEARGSDMSDARQALARVRKLEAGWATGLGKQLVTDDGQDDAVDLFVWGQELTQRLGDIGDLEHWQHLRHEVIAPLLGKTSASLLSALEGQPKEIFAHWWTEYGTALHEAFAAIEAGLRHRRHSICDEVSAALDPHLPAPWRSLPLSRKAVLTALAAPVSCVLVGMRQPGYVHDIAALREHPVRLLSAAAGPVNFHAVGASLAQVAATTDAQG